MNGSDSVAGSSQSNQEGAGIRPVTKEKRAKRPRPAFDTDFNDKHAFKDGKHGLWTDHQLTKLIDHLKKNGFDGDYQALAKVFTNCSENTLRTFFQELSRCTETFKDEDNPDKRLRLKRKSPITPAPVEEWISVVRDSVEVQRLGDSPSLILEWVANFEEFPDPASCCGVDYKSIYLYIAGLLEGRIPKQLDAPSASKLYMMFQQLVHTISQSSKTSQDLLLKTAKLPSPNVPINRDEKNRLLRERRRSVWTEEEEEHARLLKAEDLDAIKKIYCDKTGLNPFSFPPSI